MILLEAKSVAKYTILNLAVHKVVFWQNVLVINGIKSRLFFPYNCSKLDYENKEGYPEGQEKNDRMDTSAQGTFFGEIPTFPC